MIGPEEVVAEHRREMRRNGVIWLAVAVVLLVTLGVAYRTDKRADDSDKLRSQSNAQVDTLKGQVHANGQIAQSAKAAAEEANRRLAAAGKPTVPVPTEAPVSPTVAPSAGVTDAEVRSIVSSAIRAYSPTLSPAQVEQVARVAAPKVVKPKDGKSPTPAELQPLVAVAVTTFCGEDRCAKQGPKGDSAPPVTDERLSALIDTSLAAYCAAHNGCAGADSTVPGPVGPTGPVGPEGAVGEQGRSVVDMDCMDDGRWRVTYDKPFPDGETVRYSRGPCRVVAIPDPTPEAKRSK
jgi:outer membrane murein-binding lipoprotein Lpp